MSRIVVPIFDEFKPRRKFLLGSAARISAACLPDARAASNACRPTVQNIIGPFYRFGAPFETRIAGPDEAGDRVIIAGTVYSSDCRTPIPNALIEVWQANKDGLYDADKAGNFTERHAFRLRGMMLSDQQGRYEFETIMPGRYPVPPGLPELEKYAGMTRPAMFTSGYPSRCISRSLRSVISKPALSSPRTHLRAAGLRSRSTSKATVSSCVAGSTSYLPGVNGRGRPTPFEAVWMPDRSCSRPPKAAADRER